MPKPKVDQETCIGCGACVSICPEVFELGPDGKSHVKEADYDKFEKEIKNSIETCPVSAIS